MWFGEKLIIPGSSDPGVSKTIVFAHTHRPNREGCSTCLNNRFRFHGCFTTFGLLVWLQVVEPRGEEQIASEREPDTKEAANALPKNGHGRPSAKATPKDFC